MVAERFSDKTRAPAASDEDAFDPGFRVGTLARRFLQFALMVAVSAAVLCVATVAIFELVLAEQSALWKIGLFTGLSVFIVLVSGTVAYSVGRELDQVTQRQIKLLTALGPRNATQFIDPTMAKYAPEFAEAGRGMVGRFMAEVDRLTRVAYRDPLTNLPNRAALDLHMRTILTKAGYENPVGLVILDIDGMGRINDMLGADKANLIIRDVAKRLTAELDLSVERMSEGNGDAFLARLRGDDFAVVLSNGYNRERVAAYVENLRRVARNPFEHEGRPIRISLSAGICMAPDDGESCDELVHNAELALADARKNGSGTVRFFTPRLNRLARGRMRFETELREAVQNREFVPVFQPKVNFETGSIEGCEALARWQRPNGKPISPAAFIPVAEEMGLIDQIGEQILRQACNEGRRWMDMGHACSVAVNVSPRQFERDDFVTMVVDCLCETGLQPKLLELEITESLAVENPQRVADTMKPLRGMGVKLAIDDFGSGHANLSILTQLPFDVFKIDRQFVMALQNDKQAPAIIEMILAMAETLNLKTVAEGVETEAQAEFLRRRGCTTAQGFLYSPPVSADAFAKLLERGVLRPRVAPVRTAS